MNRALGPRLLAVGLAVALAGVGAVSAVACSSFSADASVTDAATEAASPDAASDAAALHVIHCGSASTTCAVPSETCCSRVAGGYTCKTLADCSCVKAGTCTTLELPCDDDTDCVGGLVCCATFDDGMYSIHAVGCVPVAACKTATSANLCDPANPRCPDGRTCGPFRDAIYPGVGYCQ